MHLIPSWAPNLHPLIVHFPIVLVLLAALVDVAALVRASKGPGRLGSALYVLGGASAVVTSVTGWVAGATVHVPGMAHGLLDDHRWWGLVTTAFFVSFAVIRVGIGALRRPRTLGQRLLLLTLTLILVVLVQQTAERGARLVYEQGVGVIGGPSQASTSTR